MTSKRSWGALLLGLLTLFITACGDSNNVTEVGPPPSGGPTSAFVGPFLGSNNLDNGQIGVLDMTVATNGEATGTLTVSGDVAFQTAIIPAGYPFSGSVNFNSGAFTVSGEIEGVGVFSIQGTLPIGAGQGSYTLSINGQPYSGTIQNASLGVPNPPGGGGGGGGGSEMLIVSGVLSGFDFIPATGYNGANPPVGNNAVISGAIATGAGRQNSVTISISDSVISGASVNISALVFGVVLQNGEQLQVGQTYPLASSANASGSIISLSQSTGTTVTRGWAPTASTTGSVTVVALTDTQVELDFNFSNVGPNSGVAGNTAQGSFSTSGTVVAQIGPTGL